MGLGQCQLLVGDGESGNKENHFLCLFLLYGLESVFMCERIKLIKAVAVYWHFSLSELSNGCHLIAF